jgi:hypothetical protein
MRQSESIKELAVALAKAQGEIRTIGFDSTNPHFKNKYASLTAIMDGVRPPLAKQGLAIVQGASESTEGFLVETMLVHSSGEFIGNVVPVPVSKHDAQGVGSAITYGRRYGVSALLALATDEEDDGNAAAKAKPEPKAPKPERVKSAEASTPEREWDGTPHDATSYKLDIKGSKLNGTPLGEIATDDLKKIHAWGAMKPEHAHLIARIDAVLALRETN